MVQSDTRIEFANTLRGLAALVVMFGHYCIVFWQYRDVASGLVNTTPLPAEIRTPAYLLALNAFEPFSFGLFGVGLFFLISGFVIPFSFERTDWRGFVIGRVLRIYPTYWAGLTVSIIVMLGMGAMSGRPFPYTGGIVALNYLPGLRDVAGVPGIDGIIWTLDIEIKFYLVCALAAALLRAGRLSIFLIPIALSIPAVLAGPTMEAMLKAGSPSYGYLSTYCTSVLFLDFMFIGVAFNFVYRRLLKPELFLLTITGLFCTMCVVWWITSTLPTKLLWTYGAALLTFAAAFAYPAVFKSRPLTDFCASISYPLYVVHGVLGYAVLRVTAEVGVPAWLTIVIGFACSIAVASAIHFAVESPSHQAGRRLASRFRRALVVPVATQRG